MVSRWRGEMRSLVGVRRDAYSGKNAKNRFVDIWYEFTVESNANEERHDALAGRSNVVFDIGTVRHFSQVSSPSLIDASPIVLEHE
jgi:hypothetical protein